MMNEVKKYRELMNVVKLAKDNLSLSNEDHEAMMIVLEEARNNLDEHKLKLETAYKNVQDFLDEMSEASQPTITEGN